MHVAALARVSAAYAPRVRQAAGNGFSNFAVLGRASAGLEQPLDTSLQTLREDFSNLWINGVRLQTFGDLRLADLPRNRWLKGLRFRSLHRRLPVLARVRQAVGAELFGK